MCWRFEVFEELFIQFADFCVYFYSFQICRQHANLCKKFSVFANLSFLSLRNFSVFNKTLFFLFLNRHFLRFFPCKFFPTPSTAFPQLLSIRKISSPPRTKFNQKDIYFLHVFLMTIHIYISCPGFFFHSRLWEPNKKREVVYSQNHEYSMTLKLTRKRKNNGF